MSELQRRHWFEIDFNLNIIYSLYFGVFVIIIIFQVLFAVTGNEFSFKESPDSMKAVMTAVFLLTEAVGNIIIIVITRLFTNYQQVFGFIVLQNIFNIVFYLRESQTFK